MTGLELLKAPEATAGEIADIISAPCPPTIPAHCDGVSCRECWLTWLTGEPIKEKEPPDKRTAPDEEGLHPNLVAFLRQRKHLLGVLEDVKDDVMIIPVTIMPKGIQQLAKASIAAVSAAGRTAPVRKSTIPTRFDNMAGVSQFFSTALSDSFRSPFGQSKS